MRERNMKKEHRKKNFSLTLGIVLAAGWKLCVVLIIVGAVRIFWSSAISEHKTAHEKEDHREEYVTEINGYDMGELSIYQALRVYDLLEANGLTDYEGRGYDRSYNYGVEDFRQLKGLDESFLYGFYCVTSDQNFQDVLSVMGYDSLDQYLLAKEYVDRDGNPSIDVWNDVTLAYMAELLAWSKTGDSEDITKEYNGYGAGDLDVYQYLRVYDLMDKNGFADYTGQGYNRFYHYDMEEFRKIKGLDETYLYGFYCAADEQNFMDALSVLGYDSLNEYLAAAGYVDEEGRPDADIWRNDSLEYASEIIEHGNTE